MIHISKSKMKMLNMKNFTSHIIFFSISMINASKLQFIFEDFLEIQEKLLYFCHEDTLEFEDI